MATLFDQETVIARITGTNTVVGKIYRIVSRTTLDFTIVGAPNNTIGTVFIADAVDTLGSGDALSEITAPDKGIPVNDPWPALAGSELAEADDMQADATGDWTKIDCTLVFDTDHYEVVWGVDTQYIHLGFSGSANQLHRVTMEVKDGTASGVIVTAKLGDANLWTDAVNIATATTTGSWVELSGYFYPNADQDVIGLYSALTAGNIEIKNFSVRPVQLSWEPYGTNTIEIDESGDALKVTFVDTVGGGKLELSDSSDLSSDLVVGERYLATFEAKCTKVAGDIFVSIDIAVDVDSPPLTAAWANYALLFVAETADADHIDFKGLSAGEEVWIRNIKIYKYEPNRIIGLNSFWV